MSSVLPGGPGVARLAAPFQPLPPLPGRGGSDRGAGDLTGSAALRNTLEDRALPVLMLRQRRAEPVARLGRATDADAQARRDGCARAGMSHIGVILARYKTAPRLLEAQGLDDRAVVSGHRSSPWR